MPNHCISHVKDIDGVSSAALVVAAKGGTFRLVDYDAFYDALASVPEEADEVVICDIGTDPNAAGRLAKALAALAKRAKVTYIDHHYLAPADRAKVKRSGVSVHHDTKDCASMLTYLTFKDRLPPAAKLLALYGAVTDYMDDSARAAKLMENFDRHFVLLEATLLSYALAKNGKDYSYVETLVRELAEMRTPHTIERVGEDALDQAEVIRRLAEQVQKNGVKLGRLAYMETSQSATGNVAKLLLGAFGVVLGVSYKPKTGGMVEASLRSTSECRLHLGREIGRIAARHGGTGGGHKKAAGFSVPVGEIQGVLKDLNSRLSKVQ